MSPPTAPVRVPAVVRTNRRLCTLTVTTAELVGRVELVVLHVLLGLQGGSKHIE